MISDKNANAMLLINHIIFLVLDKSLKFVVVKLNILSKPVLLIASEPCSSTVDQHCTFLRLKLASAKIYDDALHLCEYSDNRNSSIQSALQNGGFCAKILLMQNAVK